jgi:cytochrome c-type biogenesis protein CcmH
MKAMMDMWQFWLVAGAMVAGAALLILRARPLRDQQSPGAVALYRAQLAEIDRDLARGTLQAAEADRLRLEISRRLLEADKAQVQPARRSDDRALLGGLVLVVLGAAIAGYMWLGAPSYPDVPLASRIAEAEARRDARPDQDTAEAQVTLPAPLTPDADFAALMQRLRTAVAERPDDLTGLALLARNEASLGNFRAALDAQTALIAAKGAAVTAQDHADRAEMMIALAGGYISPQAEDVLTQALQLDAANATARYYAGLMMGQNGRYDLGFRMWRPLLDGPADAPWMAALRAQMPDMAARAGAEVELPMLEGLTPEAMVARLSERLATDGGPPEDWAQLIRSLLVLGQVERAETIRAEALQVFGDSDEAMALIRAVTAP